MAVALHPELDVGVTVIVARNAEEAERVARGEDVTVRREDAEAEEAAEVAAEAFFDPESEEAKAARGEKPEGETEDEPKEAAKS